MTAKSKDITWLGVRRKTRVNELKSKNGKPTPDKRESKTPKAKMPNKANLSKAKQALISKLFSRPLEPEKSKPAAHAMSPTPPPSRKGPSEPAIEPTHRDPAKKPVDILVKAIKPAVLDSVAYSKVAGWLGKISMTKKVQIESIARCRMSAGLEFTTTAGDVQTVLAAANNDQELREKFQFSIKKVMIHKCILFCHPGVPEDATATELLDDVIERNELPGEAYNPRRYSETFPYRGKTVVSNRFSFVPNRVMYRCLRESKENNHDLRLAATRTEIKL